jgi:Spy/CpxP family protein refolding chaperone
MKIPLLALLAVILPMPAAADGEHVHHSPYAGEELREIKSLSAEDVAELERGGGWGLAKAAELNGMPGPSHVLKMKRDLALSADQEASTHRIFEKMREDAGVEGKRLIAGEMALEIGFRDGSIDQNSLRARLREIEAIRANLRYVHLAAHLQMMQILKEEQVKRYNELRGYSR